MPSEHTVSVHSALTQCASLEPTLRVTYQILFQSRTSTQQPDMAPIPASNLGNFSIAEASIALIFLFLAGFVLPGLVYAVHTAVLYICHYYGDEEEEFESTHYLYRPLSSDRLDEYMVHYRPDLLLIDAVAVTDSVGDTMSTPPGSALSSPGVGPRKDDRRSPAAVPLLSMDAVMRYGTMNDPQ
jgi:hypothetical protein